MQDGARFCSNCGFRQDAAPEYINPTTNPAPKKKKTGVIIAVILIVVLALVAAAAAGVFFWLAGEKSEAYDDAMALLEDGKTDKALTAFRELGDYEDAPDMVENLEDYQKALKLLEKHKYDEALELFKDLGDFHDSETYVDFGVDYHKANYLLSCAETGDSDGLAWTSYDLNDYDDQQLMCRDLYLAAAELFEELRDYQDSESLAEECREAAESLESKLTDDTLQNAILGTWTVDITFTEALLGVDGMNIDGIPVTFTFDAYGELTMGFADDAAAILEEKMLGFLVETVYDEMEAEGYSRSETDELFDSYYGMSISDYMKNTLAEYGFQDLFEELEDTVAYKIEDGKLFLEDSEMDVEINGDKMTITTCNDDSWGELGLELPVVLKRVG